jgi:hypothetical protein
VNPMLAVERPKPRKPPIMFYELDAVKRIVDVQSDPARRALLALLYGTGTEVALRLTRLTWTPPQGDSRRRHEDTHAGSDRESSGLGVADLLELREGSLADGATLARDADSVYRQRLAPRDGKGARAACLSAQECAAPLGGQDPASWRSGGGRAGATRALNGEADTGHVRPVDAGERGLGPSGRRSETERA